MSKHYLIPSLVLLSSPALAQVAPAPDAAEPEPAAIVVTGTRAPTPIERTSVSATVLDKGAIDRAQDIGVAELLVRTPGVTLSRTGGLGTATSVRIRGAEGDQTVIVIDGVKLNDPSSTGGGYDFGNLLVGDAERIEVLRGPQSILWGSQAIGGVVNVVTAVPTTPLGGSFDIEAGSRDTVNARAGLGGKSGRLSWRVAGNVSTTDGISAISPRAGGLEPDGYRNFGGSGRVNIAITDNVEADLRGYYSSGRVEFDSSFGPPDTEEYGRNREWIGYAGLNVDLLEGRLRNRIAYTRTNIDHETFDPAASPGFVKTFDARGKNRRLEYQGTFAIAKGWNAVFGAESERSSFRAASFSEFFTSPEDRGRATLNSFYGQLNGEVVPGLVLNGGVRQDDHSRFGGKTLFGGGAAWSLFGGGTVLRASYTEGFKAPALYQLFSQYGNEDLRPESAHGWDAGIEQKLLDDKVVLSATYFERNTSNLIDFVSTPPRADRPFGYYLNVARAEARGIEAAASATFGGLIVDGNYSWIHSENRTVGANLGKWLARRPRHVANASVSYAWPFGLTTGAALRHAGKSFDDAANTVRLDDYNLVDLRAEMAFAKGFSLFGRVENLFDEEYMTADRYGTLGRSVYAGMRARF